MTERRHLDGDVIIRLHFNTERPAQRHGGRAPCSKAAAERPAQRQSALLKGTAAERLLSKHGQRSWKALGSLYK
ncbi:hypothetical protein EYF80_067491 [Liparis tanakae]|uniref:Uncharacterized protein n=1 Tax=Liparis tanakae TaxID=230148 RepID=A0A4Z2E0U9_9TELE|nr:hypothetical protein EYF80_067491 [Liparis tanakae]